jgi:hypothetical protein
VNRLCVNQLLPLLVLVFVILSASVAHSSVIYVDSTAAGAADGSSWADAYPELQGALGVVLPNDEIWVAKGTYFPAAATRTTSFQLPVSAVSIFGGFTGTETMLSQRDWVNNITILSGELGVDTLITDNSYHVVTGSGADSTSVLDGFTITAGNANGSGNDGKGGGVFISSGRPTFVNVVITRNNASTRGGGMYVELGSHPAIFNSTFSFNDAQLGGGMSTSTLCNPWLTNVTFTRNDADDGGGMFNDLNSDAVLTNVIFLSEDAFFNGGAMYNVASDPQLVNVTFINNEANDDGGAMYNSVSNPILVNVTFSDNTAGFDGGAMFNADSDPIITNCIVWGNNATFVDEIFNSGGTPKISYSIVKGSGGSGAGWDPTLGTDRGNNLDSDPLFVDELLGNVRLTVCSPAIDAGSSPAVDTLGVTTDLDGNARILFDAVDMGAYESQFAAGLQVFVDKDATGLGDGTSWTDAYTELRDALATSLCNNSEIWVAEGTYKATAGTARTATFMLVTGVSVYGGFGGTETLLSQRDWVTHPTILSGDIGVAADSSDNTNHIVTGSNTDSSAVLDGFTVTLGNGRQGGGVITANGTPTLRNLMICDNVAEDFGGGMYNAFGGAPTLVNVVFTRNEAKDGGAIANDNNSSPTLINVTVSVNSATGSGGGIDNAAASNPIITNTILWGNTAPTGAQIHNDVISSPVISHSDIQGSGGSGGGWDTGLGVDGGNNIDSNPSFVDAAGGNLRVNPSSLVINAGNNSAVPSGVTVDLDGNPRISSVTVDMGAYEFQGDPTLFAFPNPMAFQTQCDTITLVNVGGATLDISSIIGCNSTPFTIDTSMTAHALLPGDTTKIGVCVTPPVDFDTCMVTVTSNASNSPTQILVYVDAVTGIETSNTPRSFRIVSVAPNPFNPSTTVHFTLPAAMPVTAEIFSVTGARVRVLSDERLFGPGDNQIMWNGKNDYGSPVASGVYFVQLRTRLGIKVTRAVLLK